MQKGSSWMFLMLIVKFNKILVPSAISCPTAGAFSISQSLLSHSRSDLKLITNLLAIKYREFNTLGLGGSRWQMMLRVFWSWVKGYFFVTTQWNWFTCWGKFVFLINLNPHVGRQKKRRRRRITVGRKIIIHSSLLLLHVCHKNTMSGNDVQQANPSNLSLSIFSLSIDLNWDENNEQRSKFEILIRFHAWCTLITHRLQNGQTNWSAVATVQFIFDFTLMFISEDRMKSFILGFLFMGLFMRDGREWNQLELMQV